ncbi:branched-chain amino acid ABC transporter permease [Treponema pectinovorum]|uniref:branched-chain amino acid ABC transporter permease n=1 Tax=Treponema pectinovorum TaxID=164 RepID=UPI0011CC02B0|nr:branched-chain amino acid ABC transporter permease [Treponema pectinovorum]
MISFKTKNFAIPFVVALCSILVPFALIKLGIIDAYSSQILTMAGINATIAISVNMVSGIVGQLTLGQCAFEAIGAYSVIIFSQDLGLPIPVAMLIAPFIAAIFGFLIGFPTLKLDGDYLAIVTLAFGEIVRVILINLKSITGGANGKSLKYSFMRDDLDWGPALSYAVSVGMLIVVIVLLQNFLRSTYGRAIKAVREDEIAANSNGVNIFKYKMMGFVIASFIGGLGGALYAPIIGFIKPDLASFNNSVNMLIFVVLGGMGSISGTVIAAFVLTSVQEVLRFLGNYRLLFYPVVLIAVMLFRPQGLMGMKELSFVHSFDFFKSKIKKSKSNLNQNGKTGE